MKIKEYGINKLTLPDADVLLSLFIHPYENQRALADNVGISLGAVNQSLQRLRKAGLLGENFVLNQSAVELVELCRPRNAIILAAGSGMRMVPINYTSPKALLELGGERLIDRIIRQLHEVGITNITVVVGFMKDSFEYLIDEFGVDLVINPDYARRNNSYSLRLALDRMNNSYIIPADIRCEQNPFRSFELYSWYMVSAEADNSSSVRINRKRELVRVSGEDCGNRMVGISYLLRQDVDEVRSRLTQLCDDRRYDDVFWEEALFTGDRMMIPSRIVRGDQIVEINTFEQLRELEANSKHLRSDAILTIAEAFKCSEAEVEEISILKKGMTNRSFLFSVHGKKYIMRIPGEGTDQLIDRKKEAEVYRTIRGSGLCEDPVYINPQNGYKITAFLEGVHVCNPYNNSDVIRCMALLREFHGKGMKVAHTFDLFGMIDFYENLRNGSPSAYKDYSVTKEKILSLKAVIDAAPKDHCLTHIDAVPDNFLFCSGADGHESLHLIDWEYAGMQDPHVDIAMFCIYSLYSKHDCDKLIDIYFENRCTGELRCKIYCYIAVCGLLWSNWCEFKRQLGVEFGEYSLRQYRYAKDYYRYAQELLLQKCKEEGNA